MWFEELRVPGYGGLQGTFGMAPGITLVSGPNESGKSTLHHALITAMFGFDGSQRRLRADGAEITNLAPWGNREYGLVAKIRLGPPHSRTVRAEWSFDGEERSQALSLYDDVTGEDLSDEVREKHGNTGLGRYLLGLDRPEYCHTCTVEQAAVGAVVKTDDLETMLRRAAEVGSADVGVERASSLLDKALKDAIGARKGTHSPLSSGPLRLATSRLSLVETSLAGADQAREELHEESRRCDQLEMRRESLVAEIRSMEQELRSARIAELRRRVTAAEEASELALLPSPTEAPIDPDLIARVEANRLGENELESRRIENVPAVDGSSRALSEVQEKLNELDRTIRPLAPFELVDTSQLVEVEVGLRRMSDLDEAQEPAPEGGGAARAEDGINPSLVAGGIAVASVLAAALVSPAFLAGLLAALAVYVLLRGGSDGAASGVRGRPGVETEAELTRRLVEALDLASAPPAATPRDRATAYLAACSKRNELQDALSRRNALEVEKVDLQGPLREQRRIDEELTAIRARLHTDLSQLGIEDLGPAAFATFDRQVELDKERREAQTKAQGAAPTLDIALAGQTLDEIKQELEAAEGAFDAHRLPSDAESSRDEAEVLRELEGARARESSLASELGASRSKLQALEERQESVPEWRAEKETLTEEVEKLGQAAEAIAIAKEELLSAAEQAHRRFAPILNRAMSVDLPSITENRYGEAKVSEDLEISLVAPETGTLVPAGLLSQGTQDQIYLVQRLAILDVLASTSKGPAPLLLDDAFAHFDPSRLLGGLKLLARKAEERQVVFFVDDPDAAAGLQHLGIEHRHIELDGPSEMSSAADEMR